MVVLLLILLALVAMAVLCSSSRPRIWEFAARERWVGYFSTIDRLWWAGVEPPIPRHGGTPCTPTTLLRC